MYLECERINYPASGPSRKCKKPIRYGNFIAPATLRATLSRVSTYPYIYILYSTLRYELWKLETLILRGGIGVVPSGPLARAHLSYK